ncbi:cyclic peptide export ABC transporter [Stappia taiwanensis]|uniref:Cyclic peptide export ABC transporter n=1 Tax=Stappia taiwanensis TaxID=992267 RepID=A0A838XTW8_9HYPH|nr:cyclic peptide export ABC transporter [Stappia taiwanensis]MBA4612471.1 cyclic peptide export ABC transporter [Stappia taiwanensis]GGF05619.1 peptide ABC transporter ATP-binding protein [Stappia taiwanensis]
MTTSETTGNRSATGNMFVLFGFLIREGNLLRSPVLAFAVLASFTRSGMIYAINTIAAGASLALGNVALLAGCIAATLTFSHLARVASFRLVETTRRRLRMQLSRKLLNARAGFLARNDHGKVYSIVTQEVNEISHASVNFIESLEAALLIAFCIPYLFYLSWPSGLATLAAVGIGGIGYLVAQAPAQASAERASRTEWVFFDRVNDVLRGYKELRLRQARKAALQSDIDDVATRERSLKLVAERYYSLGQVIAQGAMMGLLCMIVVGLPLFAGTETSTVLQILTIVLLTYGPIETVLGNLSSFSRAAVSKYLIDQLERDLANDAETRASGPVADRTAFRSIELKGVTTVLSSTTAAGGDESFTVGPLDLTLTPGEVVFICGGNGAGKSTLLSVLTGLRHPDGGAILLDGTPVAEADAPAYRSLFSAVFSEFHLFNRLYGLTEAECDALPAHLADLDIDHRVGIDDGKFSTLALSTGQRRRLALSVALAEKRPIIVLDEFAADQDPVRRALFYDVLVPQMARDGHLVIAVTHDEHCFDKCDRLIRMEAGRIVSDTRQKRAERQAG